MKTERRKMALVAEVEDMMYGMVTARLTLANAMVMSHVE